MSNTKPKLRNEAKQLYLTEAETKALNLTAAKASAKLGRPLSVNQLIYHFIEYGIDNNIADKITL